MINPSATTAAQGSRAAPEKSGAMISNNWLLLGGSLWVNLCLSSETCGKSAG